MVAVEQNRIDYCFPGIEQVPQRLAERYGINRPGGQFFVSPSLWITFVAFNHDRPAFNGPGQIPLAKAITTQSTDRRWPASSATSAPSALTSCYRPRSLARRASTRSKAPTPPPRGSGSHGRRSTEHARPLREQHFTGRRHRSDTRPRPQADRDRRAGEVLLPQCARGEGRHARWAPRPRPERLDPRLRRRDRFSSHCSTEAADRASTWTTRAWTGASRRRTA